MSSRRLIGRLWSADTFVDFDAGLNTSVNKPRQALSDNAENPRFIATAGRRGYRFIAPASPSLWNGYETRQLPSSRAQPFVSLPLDPHWAGGRMAAANSTTSARDDRNSHCTSMKVHLAIYLPRRAVMAVAVLAGAL
jgi:hypothetical protein